LPAGADLFGGQAKSASAPGGHRAIRITGENLQDLAAADVYRNGRTINDNSTMKNIIIPLMAGTLLALPPAFGQPAQQRPPPTTSSVQIPDLVKFDLDFPGGTPRQLVAAIEKASGKSLNAIVSDDDAELHLPALKMRAVNVAELFQALSFASQKTIPTPGGYSTTEFGFRGLGNPSDNSVWYFYNLKPHPETKACRFYQLAPYLETYKVEDITTAIQTGWKMLGETNPPTISFHKDTKLLIAVGEQSRLQLIDFVLQQLAQGKPQPQREATGAKGAEPPKK
jgi:hypothetical protein